MRPTAQRTLLEGSHQRTRVRRMCPLQDSRAAPEAAAVSVVGCERCHAGTEVVDVIGIAICKKLTSIALTPGQTRCWFPRAAELGGGPRSGFAGRGAGLHQTRRENANQDRAPRDPGWSRCEKTVDGAAVLLLSMGGAASHGRRPKFPSRCVRALDPRRGRECARLSIIVRVLELARECV